MKKVFKWLRKGMNGLFVAMGYLAKWLIISIGILAQALLIISFWLVYFLCIALYIAGKFIFLGCKRIVTKKKVEKTDEGYIDPLDVQTDD